MFEQEENKKEKYSIEELKEMIDPKIEISGKDNRVVEISKELQDEIIFYLYNKFEIKGLAEGERFSLYFYNSNLYDNGLYLTALESEPFLAWTIEDEDIIKKIEELIS